jgi:hypothetical protein
VQVGVAEHQRERLAGELASQPVGSVHQGGDAVAPIPPEPGQLEGHRVAATAWTCRMVAPSSRHWAGDSPASAPGRASSSGYRARAKRPTVTEDAPVEVASGARTFGTPRR